MSLKGVFKRGEAQWQVKIRRRGHSLSRTFETQLEAVRWRNVMVGRIDGHEYVDRSKERETTLLNLLETYEEKATRKKKGAKQEHYRIDQWKKVDFAAWPLPSIDTATIARWIANKVESGAAPSTISNAVNLLSAVFRFAKTSEGHKIENPCKEVSRPKAKAPRSARLNAAQERKLLESCRQGPPWLVWCVSLAIETAMRASEIRRLRWEHIHRTHIHLTTTKNNELRDVPLTSSALAVIQKMKRAFPRRADGWVFGDPEIGSKREGGFTKDMLSQAYRDAAQRAGIALTFHDLRHVAITRLAPLHTNVLELAATTGHKTLGVLQRYYDPDPADRAAELRKREAARSKPRHRPRI